MATVYPVGPAESLFKESYYQLMKTALKEDGILCCQGECQWLHLDLKAFLQISIPFGELCLLYYSHLSQRPDQLHAM